MDESELKKISGNRRPQDSNLRQVKPGTPLGLARQHIYTHVRHALTDSTSVKAAYHRLVLPEPLKRRILGFLGAFGSGKTEVAVNLATQLGLAAMLDDDPFTGPVGIIDLDIVNPYFRTREAVEPLQYAGVEVIMPGPDHFWADLPIIVPEVRGRIQKAGGTLILDVGGDDLGARVLSHIQDDFKSGDYTLCMVVNANRPFTSSLEGAKTVLNELEKAAGLKMGGLVSNTHMMDETTPDEIRRGYEFTRKMGDIVDLPVLLVAAEISLLYDSGNNGVRPDEFDCPILPLYRFMLPPWRKQAKKL